MARSSIEMPNQLEAAEGHRLAVENCRRHLRCGEILAQANEHGVATAHMVLAAEEAIKTIMLIAVSLGAELSPEELRPFLTQHMPRLTAGALGALMSFFYTHWIGPVRLLVAENPAKSSTEFQEARERIFAELASELGKYKDADSSMSCTIDVINWWGMSNDLKKRGLYVDFSGNQWLGPDSITKDDFVIAHKIAQEAVGMAEGSAQAVLNGDTRQELVRVLNQVSQEYKGRQELVRLSSGSAVGSATLATQ